MLWSQASFYYWNLIGSSEVYHSNSSPLDNINSLWYRRICLLGFYCAHWPYQALVSHLSKHLQFILSLTLNSLICQQWHQVSCAITYQPLLADLRQITLLTMPVDHDWCIGKQRAVGEACVPRLRHGRQAFFCHCCFVQLILRIRVCLANNICIYPISLSIQFYLYSRGCIKQKTPFIRNVLSPKNME